MDRKWGRNVFRDVDGVLVDRNIFLTFKGSHEWETGRQGMGERRSFEDGRLKIPTLCPMYPCGSVYAVPSFFSVTTELRF